MQNEQALFPDRCWRLRSKVPILAAALLAFLTAGCYYSEQRYHPAAPGDKSSGRLPLLHFQRQGVIVGVGLPSTRNSQGTAQVAVNFEVPDGKVVKLIDKTVESSAANFAAHTGKLSRKVWERQGFWGGQIREFPPDTQMTGKTANKQQFGYARELGMDTCESDYAMFCYSAKVTVPDSGAFMIKLPRFSVNGAEIELPPLTVTQVNDTYSWILDALLQAPVGFEGGW